MSSAALHDAIEVALGQRPLSLQPLSGGCVGEVYKVQLPGNHAVVAKVGQGAGTHLACEGAMLRYLRQHSRLPVPAVLHASDNLLIMEFIAGDSRFDAVAEQHAAELLAGLHAISAPHFGFEWDTLIGGLHQPNARRSSWLEFFRDQRLLYMGNEALREGRMPARTLARLERCAGRLTEWLDEPERPALLHGDVWTTNVLAQGGRITGFLDPAIYYGHAEIELAFTTLFGTFGASFFRRYAEIHPLAPGFMELRKDLYNLYSLLVHVRLFGGSYLRSVESTLTRLGC